MDLSCQGSDYFVTPHIDRLAREGMTFTDAYAAAPVCSPTRAAIMTGKYPTRLNITDWIPGNGNTGKFKKVNDRDNLALEEVTIAEALKPAGYRNYMSGKWHVTKHTKPEGPKFNWPLSAPAWPPDNGASRKPTPRPAVAS